VSKIVSVLLVVEVLVLLMLRTPLSWGFWQGAAMVCGGAILCWLATRATRAQPASIGAPAQ